MNEAHEKTCRELSDAVMMLRRVTRALRKADPASPLPDLATDLMRRQNWLGDPLREVLAEALDSTNSGDEKRG